MKKILLSMIAAVCLSASAFAQAHSDRISLGVGLLYENGLDATLSWEHETKYHNAWEYFVNGYLKWDECGILRQWLSQMGRMCLLWAYLPGFLLEELPHLGRRCFL